MRAARLQSGLVVTLGASCVLVVGCTGGHVVSRWDTIRSIEVTIPFREGTRDALGLPETFAVAEAAGEEVAYTISDRETCERAHNILKGVQTRWTAMPIPDESYADVILRTERGKAMYLAWYSCSFFRTTTRNFFSSELSALLAGPVTRASLHEERRAPAASPGGQRGPAPGTSGRMIPRAVEASAPPYVDTLKG